MASVVSPSSSPRLPSPPPIAEVQIGPKSPIASPEEQGKLLASAERRIRPGTKAADMAEGPPLVDLSEIDSAFQLTEHLKALHYSFTHPKDSPNTIVPIDKDKALQLARPPDGVDKTLWLYELCRLLIGKTNSIVLALFKDDPPCSARTCEEMRASEWQYLCAVHEPPKSCCAIDYCCHTLDWAANMLTKTSIFPSRLSMSSEQGMINAQNKHLTNIFRRVYRIFAHAWWQHEAAFWKVELETGLYIFFKTVCVTYNLMPEDNYTIPPKAEGIEEKEQKTPIVPTPSLMTRDRSGPKGGVENGGDHILSAAHTTKRHRHSPSVGGSVPTVTEEVEEEDVQQKEQQPEQPVSPEESSVPPVESESEKTGAAPSEDVKAEEPDASSEEKSDDAAAENDKSEASPEQEKEPEKQSTSEPVDPVADVEEGGDSKKASEEQQTPASADDAQEAGDEVEAGTAEPKKAEGEASDGDPDITTLASDAGQEQKEKNEK